MFGERGIDIIHVSAIDIAEETQSDVEILRRHPARPAGRPLKKPQLPAQVFRKAQGNEVTHDLALNLRGESPFAVPIIHKKKSATIPLQAGAG